MHLGNALLQTPVQLVRAIRRTVERGPGRARWCLLIDDQGEVQLCSGDAADILLARHPGDHTITVTPAADAAVIARAVLARLIEIIPEGRS